MSLRQYIERPGREVSHPPKRRRRAFGGRRDVAAPRPSGRQSVIRPGQAASTSLQSVVCETPPIPHPWATATRTTRPTRPTEAPASPSLDSSSTSPSARSRPSQACTRQPGSPARKLTAVVQPAQLCRPRGRCRTLAVGPLWRFRRAARLAHVPQAGQRRVPLGVRQVRSARDGRRLCPAGRGWRWHRCGLLKTSPKMPC
jgi:hypothetical protein